MKNILNVFRFKSQKGVTLIEMLLYMGLLTIFMSVLTTIFTAILDVQFDTRAITSVERDGKFILSKLLYDMHSASSITTPSSLGQTSTSLQIVKNSTVYTYALTAQNLTLTDSTGTNQLNGFDTNVSNLTFTKIGNINGKHTVRIQFQLTSKTKRDKGFETRNFSTTIGLR
jgi:type II secretory pathway pseudopilin PulG